MPDWLVKKSAGKFGGRRLFVNKNIFYVMKFQNRVLFVLPAGIKTITIFFCRNMHGQVFF